MAPLDQAGLQNRLLLSLSPKLFARLAPDLELVELPKHLTLAAAGVLFEAVYFPESGIGSVLVASPEGQEVEAGLFGREGMSPVALILGVDRQPDRTVIQIPGQGHRISPRAFTAFLEESHAARRTFLHYAHTFAVQVADTALSNAVHAIDERLARWILMCDDRGDGTGVALTHEYLSTMLAVRRPSVTTSLHVLEGNGFIRSERGSIVISNRAGLVSFAADCYGKAEGEYVRLIGSMQ